MNKYDPTGLANQPGDFGWGVFNVSIGSFDDVRNLRNELNNFEVPLPRRTTGFECFNANEIRGVYELPGYNVMSSGQASAALWSMGKLTSLLSKAGSVLDKYGSLDGDTLNAINVTADKMSDVETGWDEYAAKTGNFIDMETGRPRSNAGLRNLTQQEKEDIYGTRTMDYQSRNLPVGLESTFIDPIDIVFGKLAAGAFLGKTAFRALSPSAKNGESFYSVAFETTIQKTGIGTRSSHFAQANNNLLEAIENDTMLAEAMKRLEIQMPSRYDQSPFGWTWHHVPDQPGVLQLVPRAQHQGSPWQSLLHEGKIGGFKIWGKDY